MSSYLQSLACDLKPVTNTRSPNYLLLSPPLTSKTDTPRSKNTPQPSPTYPSIVSVNHPPRCLTPLHTSKYVTPTPIFLPISTPWKYSTFASLYATCHQACKFFIYREMRGLTITTENRPRHSKYNSLPHSLKLRFGILIINPCASFHQPSRI